MDITVSRLNKRMALQLPAEFSLGLVFVVGTVRLAGAGNGDERLREFQLTEGDHNVRCRLSARASGEVPLGEGDLIRAGGHLTFEPTHAAYYLLARDVEVLREFRPSRSTLSEIIAGAGRQSRGAGLVPARLPDWIKEMAPPDLLQELEALEQEFSEDDRDWEESATWDDLVDPEAALAYPSGEPALAELSDEVIDFLSAAMDSSDDVELTPGLMSDLHFSQTVEEVSSPYSGTLAEFTQSPAEFEETTAAIEGAAELTDVDELTLAELEAIMAQEAVETGAIESRAVEPIEENKTQAQDALIPWYLVVLTIFLFLLFLAVLIFVFFILPASGYSLSFTGGLNLIQ